MIRGMTQGINICWACRHLKDIGAITPDGIETGACSAFPKGIPLDIFADGADHREPFPGDNGIQFAPITPELGDEAVAFLADDQLR
jgi:hypothetical protein